MPYHAKPTLNPEVTRLGIKFTLSENYPSSDVVGHYYVYGDRTSEKTIVDKGIKVGLSDDPFADNYGYTAAHITGLLGNDAEPSYAYLSAATLFEDKKISGDYITIEKVYDSSGILEASGGDFYSNDLYGEPIAVALSQYKLAE